MDLPQHLQTIHQAARLKIMTLLYRHGDVGFQGAHHLLHLTPRDLDAHVKRLVSAGLVESRRVLVRGKFEVRLRITPAGVDAFSEYLVHLRRFVGSIAASAERVRPVVGRS